MNRRTANLVQSLEIKLMTGETMEIRLIPGELITASSCVFHMQWRFHYTGVNVRMGTNSGSLMFKPIEGGSNQIFFIDIESVDKAISFFKRWGFQNCDT